MADSTEQSIPLTSADEVPSLNRKHTKEIEHLSTVLERIYERPFRLIWRSFWSGFYYAFGVWVGSLAIITLLGWVAVTYNLTGKAMSDVQNFFVDLQQRTVERVFVPSQDQVQELQQEVQQQIQQPQGATQNATR